MLFSNVNKQSGMTLIEMAVAIIIVGVMLGAALQLYNQNRDQYAKKVTEERMAYIVSALSKYAETNYRIPCPADPSIVTARESVVPPVGREPWRFGHEWGATAGNAGNRPGIGVCNTNDRFRGIIPFQALGISFENAKDGWGNYFSYGVSPVFTQRTDFADSVANDINDQVHERCRTQGWILGNYPINAPKARFCCAKRTAVGDGYTPTTDITITNKDGGQTTSPTRIEFNNTTCGPAVNQSCYNTLRTVTRDVPTTGRLRAANITNTNNIEAPAFVLISHGPNGRCAFLVNDTANRKACGSFEGNNGDTNQNYSVGVGQLAGGTFDDIVIWMTQFGLMAYNGGSSCSLP